MRYRIGSFNMKNFGAYPKRDFQKIADIIRGEELDVVAFQEILSEGKGLQRLLEQYVSVELYNWGFCWGAPRESTDMSKQSEMIANDSRGEGYAYIWNKKKLKLAEHTSLGKSKVFEPRIINSKSNDVNVNCSFFARTPYYIRLQPCYGGFFDLRLINIHIYFGSNTLSDVQKRLLEYNILVQDIYPSISQRRYGDFRPAYTIAMGDYNLNIFRPHVQTQSKNYLKEVYDYKDGRKSAQIITVQDQLTTLRAATQSEARTNNDANNEKIYNHEDGKKSDQIIAVQDQLTTLKAAIQSETTANNYANNYDHFTYSPEFSHFSDVSYCAIDAVQKYCGGNFEYYRTNISDHLPIMMEIEL